MMYAMAMVAEREIPARQCTMTLQFDTFALSVGGQVQTHILGKSSADNAFKVNYHFLEGDKVVVVGGVRTDVVNLLPVEARQHNTVTPNMVALCLLLPMNSFVLSSQGSNFSQ